MLKVDPTLNHIPARRAHVVALFESINQPLVNIPSHGTAPTAAYVLGTRNDQGRFTVFVYLSQGQTGAAVVYVCEPRGLTREQYRTEEAEAIRFVESMGFLVDNIHFPTLPPHEQDAVGSFLGMAVIGGPEKVRARLDAILEQTGADELIFTCDVYDPDARLRSFDILAGLRD